jgi:hypothetical protein
VVWADPVDADAADVEPVEADAHVETSTEIARAA